MNFTDAQYFIHDSIQHKISYPIKLSYLSNLLLDELISLVLLLDDAANGFK